MSGKKVSDDYSVNHGDSRRKRLVSPPKRKPHMDTHATTATTKRAQKSVNAWTKQA